MLEKKKGKESSFSYLKGSVNTPKHQGKLILVKKNTLDGSANQGYLGLILLETGQGMPKEYKRFFPSPVNSASLKGVRFASFIARIFSNLQNRS